MSSLTSCTNKNKQTNKLKTKQNKENGICGAISTGTRYIFLPQTSWLQLAVSLDCSGQVTFPLQDLDLVFVPLPQLVLQDPYDPQGPQFTVWKGNQKQHLMYGTIGKHLY